jgi:thiol-disulfide isomerase/thioredoxin
MSIQSGWKHRLILLLLLAISAGRLAAQGAGGITVGSKAPIVRVNDLDGKAVDLGQWISRKPVIMEFWATWCENCEVLLPRLKAAHQAFGGKVEFLAINVTVNQTPEKVRRYVASHEIPFRLLYDDQGASTRAYQAPATSFVVIVDRAGKVAYTGVGADQVFEPALKQVAGALN